MSTAVAAAAIFVGWSSAAQAVIVIPLNPGQVGSTAAGFPTKDCTGPFATLPTGMDGWHFVTNGQTSFVSLTLTFSGGTVGPITSTNPAAPNSGSGWSGYLAEAGNSGIIRHAYVFATAGQTLLAGAATVSPDTAAGQNFELSHTCAGTPTTPSPSPSVTVSVPAHSSAAVPSGAPDTGGGLNFGGFTLGAAAILVACAGALGLTFARRRRELS